MDVGEAILIFGCIQGVALAFLTIFEYIQVRAIRNVVVDIEHRMNALVPEGTQLGGMISEGVMGFVNSFDEDKLKKVAPLAQAVGVIVADVALQHILTATKGMAPGLDAGKAGMAIPFLPKKYQGIAQLIMPFIGGNGNAQAAQTPQRGGGGRF